MKSCSFKYKNSYFYNIMSCILFIIFILMAFIIFKYTESIIHRIIFISLLFILVNVVLVFLAKIVQIANGRFTFDKHSFIYETLNKEYTINYSEIEYISKNTYMDNDGFIKTQNYVYIVKIKNAGYFSFKYVDDSLDDAILMVAEKAKVEII